MPTVSFGQAIVQTLIEVAPMFLLVCMLFIVFSWLRLLVDHLSGRGI